MDTLPFELIIGVSNNLTKTNKDFIVIRSLYKKLNDYLEPKWKVFCLYHPITQLETEKYLYDLKINSQIIIFFFTSFFTCKKVTDDTMLKKSTVSNDGWIKKASSSIIIDELVDRCDKWEFSVKDRVCIISLRKSLLEVEVKKRFLEELKNKLVIPLIYELRACLLDDMNVKKQPSTKKMIIEEINKYWFA